MDNTNNQILDPQVVALAKAIRTTESDNNPQARGKSGEYGAYQFMPQSWNVWAKEAGVDTPLEQSTLEDQNKVAYTKIKQWKDAGYTPDKIASMWNSGHPEYQGKVGVNDQGVKYDVPQYVQSVYKEYQAIKSGKSATPQPTASTVAPETPTNAPTTQDNTYGALNPATGQETLGQGIVKGIENVPSSFLNMGKGLFNVVAHPLKTLTGLGNVVAGGAEELGGAITGNTPQNQQTSTWDAFINMLKNRYGSLDALKKTAINDPAGLALDISMLATGGGEALEGLSTAGKAGEIADLTEGLSGAEKASAIANATAYGDLGKGAQIGQTISDIGSKINPISMAGKVVGGSVNLVGKGLTTVLGGTTQKAGALEDFYNAIKKGGVSAQAANEGLAGKYTPQNIQKLLQNALGEAHQINSDKYQELLATLEKNANPQDITSLQNDLSTQLKRFRIAEVDNPAEGMTKEEARAAISNVGSDLAQNKTLRDFLDNEGDTTGNKILDFSNSDMRLDKPSQTAITNIYNEIQRLISGGGDTSAVGIDSLKKSISGMWKPNSQVGTFSTVMSNSAKKIISDIPGYTEEMKNYGEMNDFIEETTKSLSAGDKVMAETTFKKLMGIYKNNNQARLQVIQQLDDLTGGKLRPLIAGQNLSSWMPKGGLMTSGEILGTVVSAFTGGQAVIPLLGMFISSSPKLVAQFLKILGLGARGTNLVMNTLSKAINPTTMGVAAETNKVNYPISAFGQ